MKEPVQASFKHYNDAPLCKAIMEKCLRGGDFNIFQHEVNDPMLREAGTLSVPASTRSSQSPGKAMASPLWNAA